MFHERIKHHGGNATSPGELADKFRELGDWITRFQIDGLWYGGEYTATGDDRFTLFARILQQRGIEPERILECGCLEGGHPIQLAQRFPKSQIFAVDIREASLTKARFIAQISGLANIVRLRGEESHRRKTIELAASAR